MVSTNFTCFLCGKHLRGISFPHNLNLLKERPRWVQIQAEKFGGIFPMCKEHCQWIQKYPDAGEVLIYAKVRALSIKGGIDYGEE